MKKTGDESAHVNTSTKKLEKSSNALLTISEVSSKLELPKHVLRFWETKFSSLKPMKRGGGRRYYRPKDIVFLKQIRKLLYHDGYTIKGVQKLLSGNEIKTSATEVTKLKEQPKEISKDEGSKDLRRILKELEEIRNDLNDFDN